MWEIVDEFRDVHKYQVTERLMVSLGWLYKVTVTTSDGRMVMNTVFVPDND